MKKWLCFVPLLASLSFGGLIEIDFDLADSCWDHKNATLIRTNLGSFINEGETIESAVLQFTGIQNYMEPENNDALYMSLLKLNYGGSENPYDIKCYTDNEKSSNYFEGDGDKRYRWMGDKSDLGYYTDNNDDTATIEYLTGKPNYWQDSLSYKIERQKGLEEGFYLRYERMIENHNHVWSKYSNWTVDSLDRDLDVATIEEFMASTNGWIGFGIDADCHYTGDLKLVVQTSSVPEPTSLSFLLIGFASLTGAYFARKRK